jgi:ATP phosphoribosyltransferase
MISAEFYRKRAAEFRAMACFAENRAVATEWLKLAEWYVRLAQQADQNSKLDLSVEVGPALRLSDDEKDPSA